jgi:hypothetical protein
VPGDLIAAVAPLLVAAITVPTTIWVTRHNRQLRGRARLLRTWFYRVQVELDEAIDSDRWAALPQTLVCPLSAEDWRYLAEHVDEPTWLEISTAEHSVLRLVRSLPRTRDDVIEERIAGVVGRLDKANLLLGKVAHQRFFRPRSNDPLPASALDAAPRRRRGAR